MSYFTFTLQSVQKQFFGEWASPQPKSCHHIWLATKPHRKLHQGVWDIVGCLLLNPSTLIEETGLNVWWKRSDVNGNHKSRRELQAPELGHQCPPGPEMMNSVGEIAFGEFWSNLEGFITIINTLPSQWLSQVRLDHPFFHTDPERRTWGMSRQE